MHFIYFSKKKLKNMELQKRQKHFQQKNKSLVDLPEV